MKKLLTLAFLLATTLIFGQEENYEKIYLDSLNNETKMGNHKCYRIIKEDKINKEQLHVTDYYLDGKVKSEKTFLYNSYLNQIGSEKEYYPSGKLKSHKNYNENHELYGPLLFFYENGNKKIEAESVKINSDVNKEQTVLKILSYWDENSIQKVIDGNGFMIEENEFETIKGTIANGLKDGMWEGYNSKYKIPFVDKYESGKFVEGVSKDANNTEFSYSEKEKQPEFLKGGMTGLKKYINKNFITTTVSKNVSGMVFLEVTIGSDSKVKDVEVVRSLVKSLDKEAKRVIYTTSGLWTPGKFRGQNSDSKLTIPIELDIRVN